MKERHDPDPGEPDARSALRFLLWVARDHRRAVFLGVLYGVVCMLAQALMPGAIGAAIDPGVTERDQGQLLLWSGILLGLGLIQAATSILADRCALSSSLGTTYTTAQVVTRQAAWVGATLPKRMTTGAVVSVGMHDIESIGAAMGITARAAGALAAIVAVTVLMLSSSWQIGLVVLVGVPVMMAAIALLVRPLQRRQQQLRVHQGALTARAVDLAAGLRVLRGVGGEQAFVSRYRDGSQRVREAGVDVGRIDALLTGLNVLLPGLLVTLVVWLSARFAVSDRIGIGELVAFYAYAAFLALPLARLTDAAGMIVRGYVAASRVTDLLALAPEVTGGTRELTAASGAPALADPASGVAAAGGSLTAVACASSADAAALADRLGGYVHSDATYDGVPLSELRLDDVRRHVLVAGQDDRLFSGPLRVELDPTGRGGTSDDLLIEALDAASARDVVDALPGGLDASIDAGGRQLSGGEQQRLRLARSLMADPPALVLVEPTSAVDAHTEARIVGRLAVRRRGRTTVVLSTSPIVLEQADRVLLVEGGAVVAEGAHGSLLEDDRYRRVVMREDSA